MGFKQTDLVVIGSLGPTPITPAAKNSTELIYQVTRADTTPTLKLQLPADASIISMTLFGSVNSNAGTTATVTVTITNNAGTIATGTVNVLANGATTAAIQLPGLPNIEQLPLQGDLKITAQYAETGTASTTGGPWVIGVRFVR